MNRVMISSSDRTARKNRHGSRVRYGIIPAAAAFALILWLCTAGCAGILSGAGNDENEVTAVNAVTASDTVTASDAVTATDAVTASDAQEEEEKPYTGAVEVGQYITMGRYPQNGEEPEPVEWLVLSKDDEKALVISRYALDRKLFNESYTGSTWETCTLRSWLNKEFLNAAFTEEEQKYIALSHLVNEGNPERDMPGGNDTDDYIFCLSISEARELFDSAEARKAQPTPYAVSKRSFKYSQTDCTWWWLRTPGYTNRDHTFADYRGNVVTTGFDVYIDRVSVRPAFYLEY